MFPYIVFYIFVFLLSFKIKAGKWKIWDYLLLFLLIIFSSIRYGIGTDYFLYNRMYNASSAMIARNFGTSRTGMGFTKIMYQFHDVWNLDYKIFIFFCALITIVCVYVFFKKASNNPGRSILLYVALGAYVSSFNGYRQSLGISILLLGYLLFQKRKYILAALLAFIAVLMHSSMILPLLVFLIIYKFKDVEIKPVFVIIISIICYFSYNKIFPIIINFSDAYSGYENYNSTPGVGTYLMVLFYYIVYLFILSPKRKEFNNNTKIYFNLVSVGVCIMSLQLHNWLFNRLVEMFTIFMPIVLSEFYDHIYNKDNKKIVSFVFHMCAFIYFIVFINSFGEVVPYKTIFF